MIITQEKLKEIIGSLVQIYGVDGSKNSKEDGVTFSDFSFEQFKERAAELAPIIKTFDKLTYEELTEVFVLMMIGRGDMKAEDFQEEYDLQVKCVDEGRAGYLYSKAPLAKYLIDGASKLDFMDYSS